MIEAAVRLRQDIRVELIAHARQEYPNECCGLLVGAGLEIDECVRMANVDPRPASRYAIDPAAHIAVRRRLRGTPRSIIGCYHSHPAGPPVPSATDVAEAYYAEFVWVIVSAHGPHAGEIGAFRLHHGVVEAIGLETA